MSSPTVPASGVERWEISVSRLLIGIILGIITLAVAFGARYAVGYLSGGIQSAGNGLTVTSDFLSFIGSYLFLALVTALVVIRIAHNTIKRPLTVRGPLKAVVGGLSAVFFYLLLTGGTISVLIGFSPSSATGTVTFSLTLLITLVLLELSCGMRIVQGLLEYREGGSASSTTLTTTPIPPTSAQTHTVVSGPAQMAPSPTKTSFCTNCGSPVGSASFCENCGAKLNPG